MRIDRPRTRRHIEIDLGVGESPVWDERSASLWFVDILAPALFRLSIVDGALASWPMPSSIGSIGLAGDGRIVAALRDGVYLFDPATAALELLVDPEPDMPENRLNDGKVGPDGRFWIGSMVDRPDRQGVAALYRVETDGSCERMIEGLKVSNGLAWSSDGAVLYHSDSRLAFVQSFAFDRASGTLSDRKLLRRLDEAEGRPDGAACDVEGYYWSAGVSAGCLNRIAPDGSIDRKVMLPVAAPTMPCFGGPDMKTLFVTSLATGTGSARVGGTIISFEADVAGVPVARFR